MVKSEKDNEKVIQIEKPIITIVTVVYNAVDLIEDTIQSVLSQSFEQKEYIIIDGGSKDGTVDVIRRYEKQLEYFVSEPDRGIYDAMNKGLAQAKGEWLSFMNAGDTFYDHLVLSHVFQDFAVKVFDKDVKIVYGNVAMKIADHPDIIKRLENISREKEPFSLNHQSTFTRTDFLKEIGGYDTTYKIAADANSFYEAYKRGYRFVHVPVVISSYEAAEGFSAVNPMRMFREFSRIKGDKMTSFGWWKGFVKATLLTLLNSFPQKMSEKILSRYINWRVK